MTRRMLSFALAAGAILLGATGVSAQSQQWTHKDWIAERYEGSCVIRTIADETRSSLSVSVDDSGFNGLVSYDGTPIDGDEGMVNADDYFTLEIDGEPSWLGDELFLEGAGWRRNVYAVTASMTSGFTQDFVNAARAASTLTVFLTPADDGPSTRLDQFSFSGFTAAWGKIAEWCRFDPDALPAS